MGFLSQRVRQLRRDVRQLVAFEIDGVAEQRLQIGKPLLDLLEVGREGRHASRVTQRHHDDGDDQQSGEDHQPRPGRGLTGRDRNSQRQSRSDESRAAFRAPQGAAPHPGAPMPSVLALQRVADAGFGRATCHGDGCWAARWEVTGQCVSAYWTMLSPMRSACSRFSGGSW